MAQDPYQWLRNLEWLARLQDANPAGKLVQDLNPLAEGRRALEPTLSLYELVSEAIADHFASLRQVIGSATEDFRDFFQHATEFAGMMLAMGWPPPLRLPLKYRRSIREKYAQEGPERTAPFVEGILAEVYDRERLTELIRLWGSRRFLTRRMRPLEEALELHSSGRYYGSVAILLPAVEGLIADAFVHRGKFGGPQYKEYLDRLLGSEDAGLYDEFVRTFIIDKLLAQFKHGDAQQSDISRHAILHGADSDYGTRANSLRLIILFDHLQESVNDLQMEQQRQETSD